MTLSWIQQETVEMQQLQSIDEVVEVPEPPWKRSRVRRWKMEKEQQIYVKIEMYDEVPSTGVDAQGMPTSSCGYHRTGRNPTVQSVVVMLQQTKQTNSGPTLRNNRLLSKQQKNRRIGACTRCTQCISCNACEATWRMVGT